MQTRNLPCSAEKNIFRPLDQPTNLVMMSEIFSVVASCDDDYFEEEEEEIKEKTMQTKDIYADTYGKSALILGECVCIDRVKQLIRIGYTMD